MLYIGPIICAFGTATMPADSGGTLVDDPYFRRRLAECEIEVDAIEIAVLRALTGDVPPATVSSLKILCTERAQHVTELAIEIAGRNRAPMLARTSIGWAYAAPLVPPFAITATQGYFFERAQTIYGGATEVQKTIVWRSMRRPVRPLRRAGISPSSFRRNAASRPL